MGVFTIHKIEFYFCMFIENNNSFLCIVQAAYNVAGHVVSANAIEQSIFCLRTPRIGRVFPYTIYNSALIPNVNKAKEEKEKKNI